MKHSGTPFRSVLALVLLGVVTAVCISLGLWQLERAAERDALHAAIERGRLQAPVALTAQTRPADLLPWRRATAEGRWSDRHTVLLENRNLEGRPGYWVATPLMLGAEGPSAVLVLRGWLPRDMQAGGVPPSIPAETGNVRVSGELLSHVPRIFELWQWAGGRSSHLPAALPQMGGSVPVIQNLQLSEFAQATGLRLLPAVLAQTARSAPAGPDNATQPSASTAAGELRREWPGPSVDSDQNRGYALQWFSFGAIAFGAALFIARGLLRNRSGSHRTARNPHDRR